jgi:hypothetical protein
MTVGCKMSWTRNYHSPSIDAASSFCKSIGANKAKLGRPFFDSWHKAPISNRLLSRPKRLAREKRAITGPPALSAT